MDTVSASNEVAHGEITSGLRPRDWKTLRKASHDEIDPVNTGSLQCGMFLKPYNSSCKECEEK